MILEAFICASLFYLITARATNTPFIYRTPLYSILSYTYSSLSAFFLSASPSIASIIVLALRLPVPSLPKCPYLQLQQSFSSPCFGRKPTTTFNSKPLTLNPRPFSYFPTPNTHALCEARTHARKLNKIRPLTFFIIIHHQHLQPSFY